MSVMSLTPSSLHHRLVAGKALREITWLKVGGAADWLFEPHSAEELQLFLSHLPHDIPITIMGAGSNLLVRDGGVEGVVIRLAGALAEARLDGTSIHAGAGCTDGQVARFAAKQCRSNLEFLVGIPGTIGGGLRMNAGCYGSEFRDVLISATVMTRSGTIIKATADEMGMGGLAAQLLPTQTVIKHGRPLMLLGAAAYLLVVPIFLKSTVIS